MKSTAIIASILASFAFLQGVPAPPAIIGIGAAISAGATAGAAAGAAGSGIAAGVISGVVSGGVGAGITCLATDACKKRHLAAYMHAQKMAREIRKELDIREKKMGAGPGPAPAGVPQYNWDNCYHDAMKSHITITGPVGNNNIRAQGLPPSCMNLATVLDGDATGGPTPVPCGSACMEWTGMTAQYYEQIRGSINAQILKG